MRVRPDPKRLGWPVVAALGCLLAGRSEAQVPAESAPPARTADPAAEALAGWDETTGLWFPRLAPRETYLQGSDPNRNMIRDVQDAFAANTALRVAVCALVADPRREVRASALEPSLRQKRTILQMMCAGAEAAEVSKKREEDVWRDNEARFERARDSDGARARSAVERRERYLELEAADPPLDSLARLDRAFERFGLMPQAEMAIFDVLNESPFRATRSDPRFQAYLNRVFARETADGRPDAGRYLMGYEHYLFFTNRLDEARVTVRRALSVESLSAWKIDNLAVLALLDRLSGDPDGLKRAASPVPSSGERRELVRGPAGGGVLLRPRGRPREPKHRPERRESARRARWSLRGSRRC